MKSVENMFEKYGSKLLTIGSGFEMYHKNFHSLPSCVGKDWPCWNSVGNYPS